MNASAAIGALAALAVSVGASATTNPFTETFNSDAAGWRDAGGGNLAGWIGSGGPDGSGFITQGTNVNNASFDFVVALRAQGSLGSSGGAFVGNWITDGVTSFSFAVRHNAPEPLTIGARFAGAANFPGAVAINFAPVTPNVWTTVTFAISALSPQFVTFEGSDFASVFSSVSNVQLAYAVPASLAGTGTQIEFDADNVSVVPAPGAGGALVLGSISLGLVGRRRRASR